MIAQIVQKLFGPRPAGSEGVMAPLQIASANPQNADFADIAAEMDVSASLPNVAHSSVVHGSKVPLHDGQTLESDEALLAGLIAAQANLQAPVAAPISRQSEVVLAVPSAGITFDNAKDSAPDASQDTGIVNPTAIPTEPKAAHINAPQTGLVPQLTGDDPASLGDLQRVLGLQMGASNSNLAQETQFGADVQALGPDQQAILLVKDPLGQVDHANSTNAPRAHAPFINGIAHRSAGAELGAMVLTVPSPLARIAQAGQEVGQNTVVNNGTNTPPPSPVQMALQATFVQVQAVQAGKTEIAIKPVQSSVSGSASDDSDVPNSDPSASLMAAARIDSTISVPATPSQNVINFSNLQLEQGAVLGAEALAHSSLTEGSSSLGPIAEGRSVGASSIGAAAPLPSSASFGAANMPSAALSAQILPLAREAQNGGVDLTLSPAELGQLRFEMRQVGDQMQILLSAERPETLDLLRRHIDALRNDFAEAGFSDASLSFGSWSQGREQSPPPQFSPEYQEITAQSAPAPSVMSAPSPIWPQKHDAGRGLNLRL